MSGYNRPVCSYDLGVFYRAKFQRIKHFIKKKSQRQSEIFLDMFCGRLQALVYDILPSTTAVFSHAIGSRKLSANEQFFVGAQTVVSLL